MQYVTVDLIPASWHRFEQWRRHVAMLAGLAIVVLGGGTAAGMYLGHRAAVVERDLERVSSLTAQVHQLRKENAVIDARIQAVQDAHARLERYAQTDSWRRMILRLISMVPDSILLTSVSSNRVASSSAATTAQPAPDTDVADTTPLPPPVKGVLTIEGLAVDPFALNSFVDSIEADGVFQTVSLAHTRRQKLGELEGLAFAIVCAW
jgi:Tfp pilus assembly protein PilN